MRGGAALGEAAVPDGGLVVRVHRGRALQAAFGALERELDRVGGVVARERAG